VVDRNFESAEMGIEASENEYMTEPVVGPEIIQKTEQQAAMQPTGSEVTPVSPARASACTESERALQPTLLSNFTENRIPGYSSGSTKWNRKEGTRMMTPQDKQIVSEPLTDFQTK
jgi:hypothetical protein